MRLDAVASAGFRMSRSKMVDLIKSGDVRYGHGAHTCAVPCSTLLEHDDDGRDDSMEMMMWTRR